MKLNTDEKEKMPNICSAISPPSIRKHSLSEPLTDTTMEGTYNPFILSHNYLNNRNLKYRNNDDSSEDNLTLRLRSTEQKTTLRLKNQTRLGAWTLKEGSRTEQLHLYKPQQAKTIRQSFGYAFHLRNLTQHLRLGAFFFQLYHRRQASGLFCRYPYGWQHLQPKDAAAMETVLPRLCILQTLGTMDPERKYRPLPPIASLHRFGI